MIRWAALCALLHCAAADSPLCLGPLVRLRFAPPAAGTLLHAADADGVNLLRLQALTPTLLLVHVRLLRDGRLLQLAEVLAFDASSACRSLQLRLDDASVRMQADARLLARLNWTEAWDRQPLAAAAAGNSCSLALGRAQSAWAWATPANGTVQVLLDDADSTSVLCACGSCVARTLWQHDVCTRPVHGLCGLGSAPANSWPQTRK